MNFASDNVTGAAPQVLAALAAANQGAAGAYGADPLTRRVEERIAALFETEAAVFLVPTGTAANALSLAVMTPSFGAVICQEDAHIHTDECGAPEFYTGGAKLFAMPGHDGKLTLDDLAAALARRDRGVHSVRLSALSLTQASECGTVYTPAEMRTLADLAHRRGLKVHVDGARFANAVARLGCRPAEASWRAGVDILSFGASKNGALAAEAIVVFDRDLAATLAYRRKRGGHLVSKMRFLAAQFDAYLADDLWLANARRANAEAARLARGLAAIAGATLVYPVEANEIFADLPEAVIQGLFADGFHFYRWNGEGTTVVRLVCAFDTRPEHVDAFIASARRHATARWRGAV